ncbi:basic salivary proline-rich protein 1-like [Peromyscus californicus insignis]|uniref:basic salivary proline-rich protein 1-like n=1 Tax=Peromyscus californicus insignis TaxID=564181 RepID=UPI0022A6C8A2|nr:basic salivary proline-rich protein 1-like [Peromyscus californicus insignis]
MECGGGGTGGRAQTFWAQNVFPSQDPGKMEERSREEPNVPSSCGQTLRSPQEGKLGQEAPEPSDPASQGLSASQDPSKGLGAGLSPERAESQTLLTHSPRGHPGKTPQGQHGQSPRGYNGESIRGQDKGAPQGQRERKQTQQGQEFKTLQFGEGSDSEVCGEAQGEATAWRQEEGDPQGHSRDFCRPPGKPILQRVETGIPGPPGGSTQLTQAVAMQEEAWAPPPASMSPAPPVLRGPGGGIPAPGAQEPQPRLPGAVWEQRGPRDPKSSKAAWPEPGSRQDALALEEQEALQRLLELHRAAKERRRRDREQQRLRVLERLRILGNHHRRVHPLGFPPRVAQMAPQARTWGKATTSLPLEGRAGVRGFQRCSAGEGREPGCTLLAELRAQSFCHLGGCGRLETHLAGAAGTSAPRQDSVAAGTQGQEHPELPGAAVPWHRGT